MTETSFWDQGGSLLVQVAMGIGLAACAGLRAFLPLFLVGLAGRWELVPLAQPMSWLAGTPALAVFGTAVIAEIAADKVPVVDHVLDVAATFVKPLAGALIVTTVMEEWTPLSIAVGSIVVGGSTAGVVHLAKSKLRLVSSVTTAGLGNPVLSLAEDVGALLGVALALLLPVLMLVALVLAGVVGSLVLRRLRRRVRAQSSP
jgi:hypothetical protein